MSQFSNFPLRKNQISVVLDKNDYISVLTLILKKTIYLKGGYFNNSREIKINENANTPILYDYHIINNDNKNVTKI
jgi:hypothetical protein